MPSTNNSSMTHYDKTLIAMTLMFGIITATLTACDSGEKEISASAKPGAVSNDSDPRRLALSEQAKELFGPLPSPDIKPEDQARIDLGRMLFYDTRLSLESDISCNSCHSLSNFGVDNEPTSPGHLGQRGTRNTPTVYNAGLHATQFWDGRARDLTEQARDQILSQQVMAMTSDGAVVTTLASIPGYVTLFEAAYSEEKPALSFTNLTSAIASFERGLVTPDRFDAFMLGDLNALTNPELNGLELFIQTGCTSCHNGPALGGNSHQKIGLVKPYESSDPGRFGVTGEESDKTVFKVPGLRNVARTRPYFHDGSVVRLVYAIELMAEHQLGISLTDAEQASIAMFLESLTGTPDADYIAKPELPADAEITKPSGAS